MVKVEKYVRILSIKSNYLIEAVISAQKLD